MRTWFPAALTLLALPSLALAEPCEAPYNVDGLLGDLVTVEGFLRGGDDAAAGEAAKKMEAGLACMDEVLPGMIAGRALRAVAAGLYAGGDVERGTSWFKTAVEIEPTFEYGLEDMAADHPARSTYMDLRDGGSGGDPVKLERELKGTVYLDGRKMSSAKARAERLHLLQVDDSGVQSFIINGSEYPEEALVPLASAVASTGKGKKEKKDKKGKGGAAAGVVAGAAGGAVAVGGKAPKAPKGGKAEPAAETVAKTDKAPKKEAAPEEATAPTVAKAPKAEKAPKEAGGAAKQPKEQVAKEPKPEKAPKAEKAPKPEKEPKPKKPKQSKAPASSGASPLGTTIEIRRQRPWEKTPLMVGGGAILAGAGAVYYLSSQARQNFDNASTLDSVDQYYRQTNTLFLLSAGVFAVGAGTMTWGIILEGGAPMPNVQFRF